MSRWFIELESFKFHRLQSQTFVRSALVILFIFALFTSLLPHNTENLGNSLSDLINLRSLGDIIAVQDDSLFLYFFLNIILHLLAALIGVLYATCLITEQLLYYRPRTEDEYSAQFRQRMEEQRLRVHAMRIYRRAAYVQGEDGSNFQEADSHAPPPPEEQEPSPRYQWQGPASEQSFSGEHKRPAGYKISPQPRIMWQAFPTPQEELDLELEGNLVDYHRERAGEAKDSTAFRCAWQALRGAMSPTILFVLFLDLVGSLSIFFLGIPYLFSISAFLLAPFFLQSGQSLRAALKRSYTETYGLKPFILLKFLFLYLVFSFSEIVLSGFVGSYYVSFAMLSGLLYSLRSLIMGRFLGLIYLTLTHPTISTIFPKTKL